MLHLFVPFFQILFIGVNFDVALLPLTDLSLELSQAEAF